MLPITIYLIFSMLIVIWSDVTKYIIPNWLSGSLLLLYPLALWLSPAAVDWKMAMAAMLLVFFIGYIIFAMKWMGGGDIKLLTACALWVGLGHLADFVFVVALIGAVLSIGVLVIRKIEPYLPKKQGAVLPRILRTGEPIPYGVAIAGGFIVMLWLGEVPVLVFQ